MKFGQLRTGDVVNLAGTLSVVLSISKPHPTQGAPFWLFVWYVFDGDRITLDCLHPEYELVPGSTLVQDGMVSWRDAANRVHNR